MSQIPKTPDELVAKAATCMKSGDATEALQLFDQALRQHPRHPAALWQRSAALLHTGELNEALSDLNVLLREQPNNLDVRNQIRFVHRKLVPAWHFAMMNDTERNAAYQNAIERAVTPNTVVFEIGTGSGLLAMMAARAGAKHVYTCEKAMPIRNAAREIIRKNGLADKITVIDKWSTSVEIPLDMPEKADLVIAEIFGPALLEEQALDFFDDVRLRLLKPGGKILPLQATMYAALFESEEVAKRGLVGDVCGFDLREFNTLHEEPGLQLSLADFEHRLLSGPLLLKTIGFGKPDDTAKEQAVQITAQEAGICHGVVQWFRLDTDDNNSIDTSPTKGRTHWEQHVQIFEKPFIVNHGQQISFLVRQFADRFSFLHR